MDLSNLEYNETSEELVKILCTKTQNNSPLFFRVLVAYNFCKVASMMRASVNTHVRGVLPINMYAINLATSGSGKGHSTAIMEEQVLKPFRDKFLNEVYPAVAEKSLAKLAIQRAKKKESDDSIELERAIAEFEKLGPLLFSFDSGTVPAVKQLRHQLLMAGAGSMNLEIDEIGSNLLGNGEVITLYLELYDIGKTKTKLIKNTNDSQRNEEIDGRTPANAMLYGTPAKVFDGGKVEDEFNSFMETGYARRSVFGYSDPGAKNLNITPQQLYDIQTSTNTNEYIDNLASHIAELADVDYFDHQMTMEVDVILLWLEYQLFCEKRAAKMPEHDEIKRAEMAHRYFKAIKIAGAYAYVDGDIEITEEHLKSAIKLVEESGEAFNRIMTRDRPYVKLANYIVASPTPLTQPDLEEDLPFYKGGTQQRKMLEDLAIADGWRRNLVIRRSYHNGIQFLSGEKLEKTKLSELYLSYSDDITEGYESVKADFDQLSDLTTADGLHWCNHSFKNGYRHDDNALPGFNCIVLDIDDGTPIPVAQKLFEQYTYHLHTTKRHTEDHHRYRMILPISHILKMDMDEYKTFMHNIFEWLPIEIDTKTGQRSRKWATHDGEWCDNDGELLNVLMFIPDTAKNEELKKDNARYANFDALERWFISNTGDGNRNQQLLKYALVLVDADNDETTVRNAVYELNDKLANKLSRSEIDGTIMTTVRKKLKGK
ncbi:MAG: hypothetical protein Tp152SUR00d2C52646391_26 [Prokaryotic dsDNA virus sp.]|nr:MAG: hypothetical protein Tp152SUR00d2C52646391_26 [Prokaryotic dsDNA virus sp.]|tara:strand:- start:27668 stop:29806 length:2139 start_codon:yes stop_codon:yes gene_type:complete